MTKPQHIAIIMDGNGRWAQARSLKRSEGHLAGAKAVRETLSACVLHEIPYLSLYAFSTENWNRPQEEVNYLFKLFVDFVQKELPEMQKQGIRLRMIGDQEQLPFATKKALQYAINKTKNNKNTELILALNYSGSTELLRAARHSAQELVTSDDALETLMKITNKASLKKELMRLLSDNSYTEKTLRQHLFYPEVPDPDLIIRTSGELRLSNFYLLQAAYSEFYFTDVLWPDFTKNDFELALEAYAKRKRRFGKI